MKLSQKKRIKKFLTNIQSNINVLFTINFSICNHLTTNIINRLFHLCVYPRKKSWKCFQQIHIGLLSLEKHIFLPKKSSWKAPLFLIQSVSLTYSWFHEPIAHCSSPSFLGYYLLGFLAPLTAFFPAALGTLIYSRD